MATSSLLHTAATRRLQNCKHERSTRTNEPTNLAADRWASAGYIYPAGDASPPPPRPSTASSPRRPKASRDPSSAAPEKRTRDPGSRAALLLDTRSNGRESCSTTPQEVAVAVQGAMPERQQRGAPNQWALWRDGNSNYSGPAQMTCFERDSKIILKLQNSGLVLHPHLLCSFRTPVAILGQGDRIDPLNAAILDILNNMAVSRRLVLEYKLRRKSNAAEAQEHQRKLTLWRGEILQLQSKIVRAWRVAISVSLLSFLLPWSCRSRLGHRSDAFPDASHIAESSRLLPGWYLRFFTCRSTDLLVCRNALPVGTCPFFRHVKRQA